MTNHPKTLIRMANQIAGFFKPYSREDAIVEVRVHIASFWSPVMRRDLQHVIEQGAPDLDLIVVEAMSLQTHEKSEA
ncbi:formate dehydrogenase subunit delta [Beijerinckia indica]|uniref:Uncharacterized protein n=1 Tax=Beijerinckia indica subsp. indica (strain ATCC 9039 / DSM 1715 / NCIMB 8712) TaxID=395963 RepID=B2II52_BEII9|nr:formate dehydrogenase subunit delta [Beijerinckia indica]ACB94635.1 hypothetical protein Bind_0991 [Beijerinckia indica subsp. indica ATCC 9039]